jgi:hypothetical protein
MNLVNAWRDCRRTLAAAVSRRLVDNWRDVLKFSWTIRLVIAAVVLSGLEVALPIIDQWIIIPRGIFAALSWVTTAAAALARILVQSKLSGGLASQQRQPPQQEPSHD